jgi:endonuclease/exonuclease/phosphatase family metal-dependent hydrolase
MATLASRLVAAFLALGLAGCAGLSGSGGQAAESDTLRVMTFNIHHGADSQERMSVAEIAAVIRREQPDIVALQEVDRGVERTQRRDLLVELARLTGMDHRAFGKTIDHQGGQYGNAILSRHPIARQTNTLLTQREPGERRGVLQAVVNVRGRQVAVLATHFDVRNDEERFSAWVPRTVASDHLPVVAVVRLAR